MSRLGSHSIAHALRHVPNFIGVFASDQLPRLPPRDSFLVVNIDPASENGSHWVAMGHLSNPLRPPEFYDPVGLDVEGSSSVLQQNTHFHQYLVDNSQRHGHRGAFLSNRVDCQCVSQQQWPKHDVGSDDCGRWAILYCRLQELPMDVRTEAIRPQWRRVLSFASHCWSHAALLRKIVGV
jgi:hypothetical protein